MSKLFLFLAPYVVLALAALFASWQVTETVRRNLLKRAILDIPNERSMHKTPVPRGGGMAVMLVILFGLLFYALLHFAGLTFFFNTASGFSGGAGHPPSFIAYCLSSLKQVLGPLPLLALSTLLLMSISWLDDRKHVRASLRLALHLVAAFIGTLALDDRALLLGGWAPFWLDRALMVLSWAWFMNLTNFMDGIDGLTGIETLCVTTGATLIPLMVGLLTWGLPVGGFGQNIQVALTLGALMVGATGGFLIHNWHPAKIFLGDVGSVPLGFLMGYLLLNLIALGFPEAALILPLYYLADSGFTLTRRAIKGEKIWQPHRQHFYQKAAAGQGRHDTIVLWVFEVNLLLLLLSGLSVFYPLESLVAAFVVVALLLAKMHKSGQKVSP